MGGKATISLTRVGSLAVLSLGGDLTVENCAEVKGALSSAIEPGRDLAVELKDMGGVDLSFIQLLVCSGLTLASTGNALRVVGASGGDFKEALQAAGFADTRFRWE